MQFAETHLPEDNIFQDAFKAGWSRFVLRYSGDVAKATEQYKTGPVAMARLIHLHGGECRRTAAAACLAGPAVFTLMPADGLDRRLVALSAEICGVKVSSAEDFYAAIPALSADARLFLQVSAIQMMEQSIHPVSGADIVKGQNQQVCEESLRLYAAARGAVDTYSLDTRFEIAMMKANIAPENCTPLWSAAQTKSVAPKVPVFA